ncbi:MAG: proprotein convertase P-domain-containing protein, partial [Bacteroidia bacterium]
MKKFLPFILVLFFFNARAQNFSGGGGAITDNLQPTSFPLVIQGLANRLDSSFGIQQICFNISHSRANDLEIKLESPDGSVITLASRLGNATSQNFSSTCFRGNSPNSIRTAPAPFTGTYRPFEMLGA